MRRFFAVLCCLLLLCASASAGDVVFGSVSADRGSEYIDMGDEVVTDWNAFIAFLKEFPDLKKVDMFATQITRDQVALLEEALPDIAFGWNLQLMKYKNKHIVRTDATAFSTLHGKCPNHYSEEFALLKYCTDLLALDLGHNNLTDLSFLQSMPRLRVLILGENQKMKDVTEIGNLKDLEYLELFSCGITDISPLTSLTHLMDLNLGNNKVEDWRPLKKMTWLKRLWIPGMTAKAMSAADLEELQEALPDTVIMADRKYKDNPTGNGWRTDPKTKVNDPHYDVVYEIFQTGVYIPFPESAPLPGEDGMEVTDLDPADLGEPAPDAEEIPAETSNP